MTILLKKCGQSERWLYGLLMYLIVLLLGTYDFSHKVLMEKGANTLKQHDIENFMIYQDGVQG